MCDYSLMSLPNRLAVRGEELLVHKFELGSMGLVSEVDLRRTEEMAQSAKLGFFEKVRRVLFPVVTQCCTAVCVPPGAELLIRDISEELSLALGLDSTTQQVVFTQIGTSGYRDAIRFGNGTELLLQKLNEGQRVRILALSPEESKDAPLETEAVRIAGM